MEQTGLYTQEYLDSLSIQQLNAHEAHHSDSIHELCQELETLRENILLIKMTKNQRYAEAKQ